MKSCVRRGITPTIDHRSQMGRESSEGTMKSLLPEQVWLSLVPVDMRLGIDGLSRQIQAVLGKSPCGSLRPIGKFKCQQCYCVDDYFIQNINDRNHLFYNSEMDDLAEISCLNLDPVLAQRVQAKLQQLSEHNQQLLQQAPRVTEIRP